MEYSVVYTLEYMVNTYQVDAKTDYKNQFINMVYENERNIFSSYKLSFPSDFNDYLNHFKNYNYDDMCAYFSPGDNFCYSIAQGILSKGLRTSVVSLVENNRDIISVFDKSNKTAAGV